MTGYRSNAGMICAAGLSFAFGLIPYASAQDSHKEAQRMEAGGEAVRARDELRAAAERAPNDPLALESYAEFLDHHHDPGTRTVYQKLSDLLARNNANATERANISRRLAVLDLLAGDRAAAEKHLGDYRSAGGRNFTLAAAVAPVAPSYIEIPGPLRSFSRMAAISPDSSSSDVLASLAHNVNLNGYSATRASESLEPTEFMKLINRYLSQARELEKLAGPSKVLEVKTCDSTETGDLLRILGYRMRGGCGSDVILETVNPSRAFLTIDSGFPLAELETSLRTNRPFTIDYHPSRVPILFGADYWKPASTKPDAKAESKQDQTPFIDYFMADPTLCRLYSALAALDPDTADQIHKDMPAARAKIYAHIFDFFGTMFEVRDGHAVLPGGARSEKMWSELAGSTPDKGAAFFEKMVEKDDGWLAAFYDSFARINGPVQAYLTEPEHLKRFYNAIRGRVTSPGPARPVFRANTDLILLSARLRLDPDGKPHLPGGIDVWKNLFAGKAQAKYDPRLAKAAPGWKDADDVLEALFGMCRKITDNEPLKIFMALTDIERNRAKPLSANTVDVLVREYKNIGSQYALFAEAPTVSDGTITSFVESVRALAAIKDTALRSDAAGTLQSLASFWQIFVRQNNIRENAADAAMAETVALFAKIQTQRDLFDAGEKGLRGLLKAANAPNPAGPVQDQLMDLLAGTKPAGNAALEDAHEQMLRQMTQVFEAQRLVSLDTIFGLSERLENAATGQKLDVAAAAKLAGRITETQLPRSALSTRERTEMSAGYWTDKHIDAERKLNLRASIDKAGADPQKLRDVRGGLAPVLRDTLVGLNYVHYAPPGAQVLFTNPAFVRSHDFIGNPERPRTWLGTEVAGSGWPTNAGGRLTGSLIALPYALAEAEQNFLIPSREQALIWGDLVPQMILTAVVPRWWNVTPTQLHWVGLHMNYAQTALAEAALDEASRKRVLAVLDHYVPPARLRKIEHQLQEGEVRAAVENVVPSEMYLLARELAVMETSSEPSSSELLRDIRQLTVDAPTELTPRAISHAFGTPKPMLSTSYQPELLNLRTFPTLMGYSSRILAESWESNLLYYAALADDVHMAPAELNLRVPEWTQQTVERIFATHLDDWPALLRSLRLVGDEVREKARKQTLAESKADSKALN